MRAWVFVLLVVGCKDARRDCCDLGDDLARLDGATCAEQGGTTVPEYVCEGVDDDDVHDTDETDAVDESLPDDQAGRCALFCDLETALCPDDDACEHSCNTSTTPPSQADVDCAAAATTCEETYPCWDFQTF
jgi:hypothetical protein